MKKQNSGRRLHSLGETYIIMYRAIRTIPHLLRAEKDGAMSGALQERLMLAVTEVNGCAMCSYAHTKIALEAGLPAEEIETMLAGEMRGAPQEELPAILFAQHYADARGKPSQEAWGRVVALYGREKAMAILGAIRGIMMGNAYGIPAGSLLGRLRVRHYRVDARSSLPYELAMLVSLFIFPPVAALQALAASLMRLPVEPR